MKIRTLASSEALAEHWEDNDYGVLCVPRLGHGDGPDQPVHIACDRCAAECGIASTSLEVLPKVALVICDGCVVEASVLGKEGFEATLIATAQKLVLFLDDEDCCVSHAPLHAVMGLLYNCPVCKKAWMHRHNGETPYWEEIV